MALETGESFGNPVAGFVTDSDGRLIVTGTAGGPLAPSAAVTSGQSVITATTGRATTSAANGTKYLALPSADITGLSGNAPTNLLHIPLAMIDVADWAVDGYTSKLKLRGMAHNASTAPAVSLTCSLYTYGISAGTITPGTVVTGSSVTVALSTSNAFTPIAGPKFDLPMDGSYILGWTVSGTPAAAFWFYLELRHTWDAA